MPDTMENNLIKLLDGLPLDELTGELCDFTLEEQNAATEAQGVQPSASSDFTPIVRKSVTYIVACVIINENNEILMMQEAKESCAGKWYLPAGRMEPGELIVDAAVREVFEETGINIKITTLLGVECAGGSWFRFILTGYVTGGELKTPANADKESLQAKWILNLNELSLRANDMLPLIDMARNYKNRQTSDQQWHMDVLPLKKSHTKNYLRVLAAIKKRSTNKIHILLSEKNTYHFPTVEIHPGRNIHSTLRKFMIELFGAELPQHRPHGILTVEHCPVTFNSNNFNNNNNDNSNNSNDMNDIDSETITDGICLTILVVFRPALEDVSLIGKCVWHEISKNLDERLTNVLSSRHSTLALHVVR